MELNQIIGENIRKYRKEKDISQEAIAKCIGISQQAYLNLEKGETSWKIEYLTTISDFIKVPLYKLLDGIPSVEQNSYNGNNYSQIARADNVIFGITDREIENYNEVIRSLKQQILAHQDTIVSLKETIKLQTQIMNKGVNNSSISK